MSTITIFIKRLIHALFNRSRPKGETINQQQKCIIYIATWVPTICIISVVVMNNCNLLNVQCQNELSFKNIVYLQ